jgi:hypothetical protein
MEELEKSGSFFFLGEIETKIRFYNFWNCDTFIFVE